MTIIIVGLSTGNDYTLKINEPYSISHHTNDSSGITGTLKIGTTFIKNKIYINESKKSLEARIAKLKHDNEFKDKLNGLINEN